MLGMLLTDARRLDARWLPNEQLWSAAKILSVHTSQQSPSSTTSLLGNKALLLPD